MVGRDNLFISLFLGGNGTSKSASGVNIIANIVFGMQKFVPVVCPEGEDYDADKYNWRKEWGEPPKTWFDYPLFTNFRYLKRGRIISDSTTIKEKIAPELKKWLPVNSYNVFDGKNEEIHRGKPYDTSKEGKQFECKFVFKNGWIIDLMTNEQAVSEFESVDLGFCWFDEPIRKAIFYATVARMRRGGIMFGTLTPLKHSAWIKDELVDKADGKYSNYLYVDLIDNSIERGQRGILTQKDIERMVRAYPEEEREARVHGGFGHLVGRVFKNYNEKIHVIKPMPINYDDYVVVMAVDPHPNYPHHCLWVAIDRKNKARAIAELAVGGNTKDLAEAIKQIEKPTRLSEWRIIDRLIDPMANTGDQREEDDRSMREKLEDDHELIFELGSKKRNQCIGEIRDALDYYIDPKTNEFVEQPMLEFFETCEGARKEMRNYVWDEWRGKANEDRTPKQKPVDRGDHYIENLGRILINNYAYYPPETDYSKMGRARRNLEIAIKKKQGDFNISEEDVIAREDEANFADDL